jgi:hypothetical protein
MTPVMPRDLRPATTARHVRAALAGAGVSALGGLIGLGGAEFTMTSPRADVAGHDINAECLIARA